MKTIHLLRHFKVKDTVSSKLDSKEFDEWVDLYDTFELEYHHIKLPQNIDKIYASSLKRAVKTAEYLKKDFTISDQLIEVEASSFIKTKQKFSKNFWLIIGRVLWYCNLTKKEKRKDTIQRAKEFIEKLHNENKDRVLIVSHGLFLKIFIQEL